MWLLNIDKLDKPELLQVSEESTPKYAVLSHTWGSEEIRNAAALAARDGYQYIWVVTCCIDKISSAQLSEAINSIDVRTSLAHITGIDVRASLWKTTRIEDTAYCLMGLFDVNMPLLYREGKKAFFIRLQEEITPHNFAQAENHKPVPPSVFRTSATWSIANQGPQLVFFLITYLDDYDKIVGNESTMLF
ncbi:HET-domain-containing protein [Xylariaceae sp. FL1019]|nr:HET-domain-containing protein [Xylariaceae sp. FL1019]